MERERVVPGRHGRVRGEHRGGPDLLERRVEGRSLLDEIPDALERDEGRVSLVQVPHRRLDADGPEGPDAAKAQDQLLLDPRLLVAAVQPRREVPVPRRVLLEARVEQQQPDLADPDLPDERFDRPAAERDLDDAPIALGGDHRPDRGVVPVQEFVGLLLPALGRDALVEVALGIHEAHADERHPEVAGLLAEVTGQDAETAGVDRQRLMQRELGGEVRDGLGRGFRVRLGPPRLPRGPGRPQVADRVVVERQERAVAGDGLQPVRRDLAQHGDGVVGAGPPERVVQAAEQAPRTEVPAPPQVGRQFSEVFDAIGKRGKRRSHQAGNPSVTRDAGWDKRSSYRPTPAAVNACGPAAGPAPPRAVVVAPGGGYNPGDRSPWSHACPHE